MTEAYVALPYALKYYGKVRNGAITKYTAEIPFNFVLQKILTNDLIAPDLEEIIYSWIHRMPKGKKIHPNWIVSDV